jgi:HAD superfamily hydrolase (TIGR01549 family)
MGTRLAPVSDINAVLFDLHSTLVDGGNPRTWLEAAWVRAGRSGTPVSALGMEGRDRLADWLDRIWEHANEVDPGSQRDLSPQRHREVYEELMGRVPGMDEALSDALYQTTLDQWTAFEDARPVLEELKRRGRRIALVSNVGVDIRPVLVRGNLLDLFDAIILSCEVGSVKPQAAIFQRALEALGATPEQALMVGDNAHDDAGAARLGIRTLLLPRTQGRSHGLELVLRLVGA